MKLIPLTHRVEGSVADRQGKPIAGARIGVREAHPQESDVDPGREESGDPVLGLSVTDDAGKFSVTLPQDASAFLYASHPRHFGTTMIVRTDAKTVGPMTLQPAGWIAGKVTDAATGKPVAGAAVGAQFLERRRKMVTDGWGQAVTDDQGHFIVGGLEPGVYNLVLMRGARPQPCHGGGGGGRAGQDG